MLKDKEIRAGWEAERENIRKHLLERKFNPKSIDRAAANFIDSMVFAGIPCTSRNAVVASAKEYAKRVT